MADALRDRERVPSGGQPFVDAPGVGQRLGAVPERVGLALRMTQGSGEIEGGLGEFESGQWHTAEDQPVAGGRPRRDDAQQIAGILEQIRGAAQ